MKKVGLDVWIQLISMLSIVASLIFVGLEMRQTQQIAIAGSNISRKCDRSEFFGCSSFLFFHRYLIVSFGENKNY